jgi:uncharacterized lipoprotein YddW (UPF0748 family)
MLRRLLLPAISLLTTIPGFSQAFAPISDRPPAVTREFRGAWIACIYNLDWPSSKGLGAEQQQSELRAMLDKMASLNMNAVIFQVRPHCDAVYQSSMEPWSPWLSGSMGKSPGYDPLAFCIREAHARGIEVHAWFNPFRALSSNTIPCCSSHVTQSRPGITKPFGSMMWCDPSLQETRSRATNVILDVVRRYDVDGVHLDDYFYPYPAAGSVFRDGKSPAERRAYVDGFVSNLYSSVKSAKPWVRVGISPFGIWRPGVPEGIEAGLDSYEQLAGDSRKWLKNGWVDYLAPQLYWRDSPRKQSFSALLSWWRQQGSRPVWPGIATARISSSEDPGRPASEIINQINLSRTIGKNWVGNIQWSAKSVVTNRGGIATQLAKTYSQPAAVPPMPWLSSKPPAVPGVSAQTSGGGTFVRWVLADTNASKVAIQARYGGTWRMVKVCSASGKGLTIPAAEAVAVSTIDRFGSVSAPKVLGRQ